MDDQIAVGEVISFRLYINLPQGSTNELIATIRVENTNGTKHCIAFRFFFFLFSDSLFLESAALAIVQAKVVVMPENMNSSSLSLGNTVAFFDTTNDTIADTTVFNCTRLTNSPDGTSQGTNDTLVVEVLVLVLNISGNVDGRVLHSFAEVTYKGTTNYTLTADPVSITVIEPAINVNKTAYPYEDVQAGDVVTYTITLSHLPISTAPGYDIVVRDDLSQLLELVVGSVIPPEGAEVISGNGEGNTSIVVRPAVFVNTASPIIITYNATITSSVHIGTTVYNYAHLDYYSSLGNTYNTHSRREYTNSTFGYARTPSPILYFSLLTSNPQTPNAYITIGEALTFVCNISLPQGTTQNATLRVWMPYAPGILEIKLATIFLMPVNVTSANSSLHEGLEIPGADTNNDTYIDSVIFELGDILNIPDADRNGPLDRIVIEVVAIALNLPENKGGIDLTGYAEFLYYVEGEPIAQTPYISVRIIEPVLTISKSGTPTDLMEAGEVVTYTVVIDHNNLVSTSAAFDVYVIDTLSESFMLDPNSIQMSMGTIVPNGNTLTVHIPAFELNNGSLIISYNTTVSPQAPAASYVYNYVHANYYSSFINPYNLGNIRNGTVSDNTFFTTPHPNMTYPFLFNILFIKCFHL